MRGRQGSKIPAGALVLFSQARCLDLRSAHVLEHLVPSAEPSPTTKAPADQTEENCDCVVKYNIRTICRPEDRVKLFMTWVLAESLLTTNDAQIYRHGEFLAYNPYMEFLPVVHMEVEYSSFPPRLNSRWKKQEMTV